jgi:hypothetical protein
MIKPFVEHLYCERCCGAEDRDCKASTSLRQGATISDCANAENGERDSYHNRR